MTIKKLDNFRFFDTVELANILYARYFNVANTADNIAVSAICERVGNEPFSMPIAAEIVSNVQGFRTKGYKDVQKDIYNAIAPAIVTRFYYREV